MSRPGDLEDLTLLEEAGAWPELPALDDVTHQGLVALTGRKGIDFATALLYDRLRKSPRHGELLRQCAGAPLASLPREVKQPWIVVPGAFYREHPETGADGAAIQSRAAILGIPCQVVPTGSFGSLDSNAAILEQCLRGRGGAPAVLISLSKGSLEVRRLLERPDAEEIFRGVRAWISLAGLPCGSPLVSWLLQRPWRTAGVRALFWWRGYDFRVVRELNRTEALTQSRWTLPRSMKAVHVVGFPLHRHLSSALMRRGHRRLAEHGPNDGAGIILADVVGWPGVVYPVWGADHYLRTAHDDLSTFVPRLLRYIDAEPTPVISCAAAT
jgi:hypothetical protein